jgi:hypothetical protein
MPMRPSLSVSIATFVAFSDVAQHVLAGDAAAIEQQLAGAARPRRHTNPTLSNLAWRASS